MQTGKILGIGAALSAGLLAAQVASASVQLEVSNGGPTTAITLTSLGSGAYSASSSNYGGLTWNSLDVSVLGPGALGFSVQGLTYNTSGEAIFYATGTGFTYLATNPNTLDSTGGGGYTGSSSGIGLSQVGYAATSNAAFDTSGDNTSLQSSGPAGGGAITASTGTNPNVTGLTGAGYSLTYEAIFSFGASGDVYGTLAAPAGGTVSILGGVANAVALPGTGPLTLVGGLVLVGGLAIRRRMKA